MRLECLIVDETEIALIAEWRALGAGHHEAVACALFGIWPADCAGENEIAAARERARRGGA